jgi:predicted glutamine amidotransferase
MVNKMCRLFAISLKEKGNIKSDVNAFLAHFGKTNEDGTGISFISKNEIKTIKSKEPAIQFIYNNNYDLITNSLIAHVRSATTGSKSDENAHPFMNEDNSLVMCHNGMLRDYEEIEDELKKTHKFTSQTDSEILLHLFEEHNKDFIKFINDKKITGWANILLMAKDGTIYAYSDGSIYYIENDKGILVLQEKLLKNMKEVKMGNLLTIKHGKIISNEPIGKLYTFSNSTYITYSNYNGYERTVYSIPKEKSYTLQIETELAEYLRLEKWQVTIVDIGSKFQIEISNLKKNQAKRIQKAFSCFKRYFQKRINSEDYYMIKVTIKIATFSKLLYNDKDEIPYQKELNEDSPYLN